MASFLEMNPAVSPLPPAAKNLAPEPHLRAVIVQPLPEFEAAATLRLTNAPTRKATRNFRHIPLRIAAIHAECVQLHQLARVVLVKTALWPLGIPAAHPLQPLGGVWIDGLKIVEVKQHGRTLGRGD